MVEKNNGTLQTKINVKIRMKIACFESLAFFLFFGKHFLPTFDSFIVSACCNVWIRFKRSSNSGEEVPTLVYGWEEAEIVACAKSVSNHAAAKKYKQLPEVAELLEEFRL